MIKLTMNMLCYKEDDISGIVSTALRVLKKGGVVAYPTESSYALGVLATHGKAVERLFELKMRMHDKPVPVIAGDMECLRSVVKDIPARADTLIKEFWPGPLTIIFNAVDDLPVLLTGGTGKVAVRIPGESAALYLARGLGLPITATSANPSGQDPAGHPDEILRYFGNNIDLIIDDGKTPGGKPSTIIDVTTTPPQILREGRIRIVSP